MVLIGQKKQSVGPFLVSLTYSLLSVCILSEAKNTLSKGQQLKDGEFLTSPDGVFELGFFSTVNSSTSRYIGIRYHSIQDKAIVWIANRNSPISDPNGSLAIAEDGNLVVRDGNGIKVWNSSSNVLGSNNTVAVLLTTGNLILTNNVSAVDTEKVYWQSFKDPTDALLPYMGVQLKTLPIESGVFTSWSSETDPSTGNFTMGVDSRGTPQIVIWEKSRRIWRSGHWTGTSFTGYHGEIKVRVQADGQTYLTYNSSESSDLLRSQISWDGYLDQSRWDERENKWTLMQRQPANECDKYNYCGNFGVCSSSNNPKCSCMYGFNPTNSEGWRTMNWTGGCWRSLPICQNVINSRIKEDGFRLLKSVKLPDFADVIGTESSYDDCRSRCLRNCSCNAFAYVGGIGCMSWSSDLIDIQHFDEYGFNDLYVRLASSELESDSSRLYPRIIIGVSSGVFGPLLVCLVICILKKKSKGMRIPESEVPLYDMNEGRLYSGLANPTFDSSQVNNPDLPMFKFKEVAAATENFSEENMLGQGGFGPVYKGQLPGGEKIAVKRLSKVSGQGLEEFKNEIIFIAKLQHRNLVRLLGWCIQGEEKILLYEFMPNKSLDCFIFDPAMKALLDWPKRFSIIEGIARGLLYLHRDSRLRIIHRDLKASNILLDEDMNPKISDFGMAKIFDGNQSEANTSRVVGTFGYMSPEYAMEGLFSVKSDVYSFGVLLLEIVCGRRNTSFRLPDHPNLIAYAWQLWNEGRAIDLLDSSIRNSCSEEVVKCIQVGILCVQDSALHRPTMQAVVSMLESNVAKLPLPEQPTFTVVRTCMDTGICGDGPQMVSSNDLTVTAVVGR